MANRNFASGGKIYSMHVMPVLVDCNFIVDNTQPSGISSLKGPLVSQVLMNSAAATPTQVIAAGTILVKLSDDYNGCFNALSASIVTAPSGSDVKIDNAALTAGVAYRITTLGDATEAQLQAVGLPAGITPAVGVSFIATATGIAGNVLTTRVQAAATTSTVATLALAADPNLTASSDESSSGAYAIFQCRDYAGALVAPPAGSKISIQMYMSNSSIQIAGE